MDGKGACLMMKNIGKPCAGKPHARFDEGRVIRHPPTLPLEIDPLEMYTRLEAEASLIPEPESIDKIRPVPAHDQEFNVSCV
jgi:hypothetical protein